MRIATVVNFPAGGEDVERVIDDVNEALGDGAQEIDLVLPYGAVRRGEPAHRRARWSAAVRDVVDQGRLLKVILETGELAEPGLIETASRIAIEAGADFLKTSTGKTPVSATPEAAEIMLERHQGVGPARRPQALGRHPHARATRRSISTSPTASWAPAGRRRATFRIGASSLYDALVAAIEGRAGRRRSESTEHDAPAAGDHPPQARRRRARRRGRSSTSSPGLTAGHVSEGQAAAFAMAVFFRGLSVAGARGADPRHDALRRGAALGPARARSSTSTRPAASATRSASRSRPRSRPAAASCR